MLVEAFLRGLVVVRTDTEDAVDTTEITRLQLLDDGSGVIAATAHQDGHTSLHEIDHKILDLALLVGCQCGGLACRCQNAEEVGPVVKLVLHQPLE